MGAATDGTGWGRAALVMAAGTAASRGLGFARALVMAAVLGPGLFGNTYTAANYVPNIVFELVIAGALSAVLVPALVERLGRGDRRDAEHLAGAVLGLVGVALGVLAVAGAVAAPWIMRALTVAVDDPAAREDQVRLGALFLRCFAPQLVLYAWAMVATAALHAQRRFLAPTLAPAASTVVVLAALATYAAMASGARPLDQPRSHVLVLGLGTTAGVLALALVPAIALARSGFSLRPRLDLRHPGLRLLRRLGLWAAFSLAATQFLSLGVVVLGGGVPGGLVVWQLAFTFFLVPHALLTQPIFTALFSRLAELAASGDDAAIRDVTASGLRAIAFVTVPAAACYVVLARPLLAALEYSRFEGASVVQTADAVAALAVGLLPYGAVQLVTRSCYARGDGRTPGVTTALIVGAGLAVMALAAAELSPAHVVAGLAGAHTLGYLLGAVVLTARRRVLAPVIGTVAGSALAAAAGGAAAWVARQAVPGSGRVGAVAELLAGGVVLVTVYLGAQWLRGSPEIRQLRRILRPSLP
ncbi:MAG: murein biosynthesis integral membrane protein MurJ [Actinomycetota bacterium]